MIFEMENHRIPSHYDLHIKNFNSDELKFLIEYQYNVVMNMKPNKVISGFLCLLTALSALILPVRAAGGETITLTYCVEGANNAQVPMTGVEFSIYRVGTIGEDGKITPLAAFREYVPESADSSAQVWSDAAAKLEEDLVANKLTSVQPAARAQTNSSGAVRFENLEPGVYFVRSTKVQNGRYMYTTLPIFFSAFNHTIAIKYSRQLLYEDLRVVKVWRDACHPSRRPKSITIRLMRDGVKYSEITLPQKGKWEYTWKDLETRYQWTVEEDPITGYKKPEIRYENGLVTVTNACNRPASHTNTTLVQTGQLWWPVPALLVAGLLLVIVGLIRRRGDSDED